MTDDLPAPAQPRATASLIGYYSVLATVGLAAALMGPTLPALAAQTRTTLSGISGLFVARSVGYIAGSLLGGRLYDRLPGHRLMGLAGVVMAAGLALMPVTPWAGLLFGVMLVVGAAQAWLDVGSNTLLVWLYGAGVTRYMNGLHFAYGVGAFLAPLIVAQALAWTGGVQGAFWAVAVLSLPPALWLGRRPSPARPRPAAVVQAPAPPVNYRLVALFVMCFFFYVGAEVSYGAWIYTYANATGLADAATGAYLTAAFWGTITLGRLMAIPLAARFRPRTLLALDLAGGLLSIGLAAVWTGEAWVLWVSTLGAGLSLASLFPTLMAFASRRLALTGQITSLFFVGGSLGATALPWLVGQLFEPVGPGVLPALVLASLAAEALAFGVLLVLAPQPTRVPEAAPSSSAPAVIPEPPA